MLDSLVRVSRRVEWNHFVTIFTSRNAPTSETTHTCWISQGNAHNGGHCNQTRGLQSRDEFYKAHSLTRKQTTIRQEFSSTPNWRWQARQEAPRTSKSRPAARLALKQPTVTLARNNLTKKHWFHSLPFQQFQALLTLFPKSFSSFPHGTCLLSVSNLYLALDEIYHLWRSKPEERDS